MVESAGLSAEEHWGPKKMKLTRLPAGSVVGELYNGGIERLINTVRVSQLDPARDWLKRNETQKSKKRAAAAPRAKKKGK
jgi:hypothetical protein